MRSRPLGPAPLSRLRRRCERTVLIVDSGKQGETRASAQPTGSDANAVPALSLPDGERCGAEKASGSDMKDAVLSFIALSVQNPCRNPSFC